MARRARQGRLFLWQLHRRNAAHDLSSRAASLALFPALVALLVRRVDSLWEELLRELRAEAKRLGLTPEQVATAVRETRRRVFAEQYGE